MLKLIVGLGNPGPTYTHTRHNAGSSWVDTLAQQERVNFHLDKKFDLELAELRFDSQHCMLAKTTTYMNLSGAPIARFAKFFQLQPQELLIVHDDLDLPPGQIRLKQGGGHGGHNGLRDIILHLGSNCFYRLRIGIGHPGHKDAVSHFVLQAPKPDEKLELEHARMRALQFTPELLRGEFAKVMNALNQKPVG